MNAKIKNTDHANTEPSRSNSLDFVERKVHRLEVEDKEANKTSVGEVYAK